MSETQKLTEEQIQVAGVIACLMITGREPKTEAQKSAATQMAIVLDEQLRKKGLRLASVEA